MIRRLVALAAVALAVLIAGCAAIPDKPAPEALSRIKRVGVVSLAVTEFNRHYTGFTVFGNEHETLDITSWGVDDEYERQIAEAMGKLGRFEAVRIPGARKELSSYYAASTAWDRDARWNAIESTVKNIASRERVDALVLVLRRESGDFLARTNQMIKGTGYYVRGLGDHTSVSVMHILAEAVLVDGVTGRPLARRDLATAQEGPRTHDRVALLADVRPEIARAKFATYDDARRADIRQQVIDLPKRAWDPTLRALFSPAG